MEAPLIPTLISLFGACASAVVAFFVARRQARTEIQKVRLQADAQYLQALHKRRIEIYPAFYSILADISALIIQKRLDPSDLIGAIERIHTWDRENALFFSALSTKSLIKLRKVVSELSQLRSGELSQNRIKNDLWPLLIQMQLCLKNEIGVMNAEGYHNPARVKSYFETITDNTNI